MRPFSEYVRVILKHEGLYNNDSSDPGGATNRGISLRFLKMKGIDINHDGDINVKDIQDVTVEIATDLYYNHFWLPMNLEPVENELLKLHLFDMGVNAGTKTAIKILQRMLGLLDDGIIGKITLKAIKNYKHDIIKDYSNARMQYYINCTHKNWKLRKYLRGWSNRIASTKFLKPL